MTLTIRIVDHFDGRYVVEFVGASAPPSFTASSETEAIDRAMGFVKDNTLMYSRVVIDFVERGPLEGED